MVVYEMKTRRVECGVFIDTLNADFGTWIGLRWSFGGEERYKIWIWRNFVWMLSFNYIIDTNVRIWN